MRLLFACCVILILTYSCNNKLKTSVFTKNSDIEKMLDIPKKEEYKSTCRNPLSYTPQPDYLDFFDKRTVRINFHFSDDSTRVNNFNKPEGNVFFKNMINNCNYRFGINKPMVLPVGNQTPNLNPQFELEITPSKGKEEEKGFYYETDSIDAFFINKGRDRNNYNRNIIKKYAVDDDTILNAFIMPHHPDSLISKTYKAYGSGIALGSSIKVGGIHQFGGADWAYATLLNHEVGHVFGLSHAWATDGCDDTPKHKNCYSDTGIAPCDGPQSNNMMDYNNSQMSITPCQLGKMHMKISDTTAFQRKLVIPTWCKLKEDWDIIIKDSVSWMGGRDVSRNINVADGGHLTICCRLSMPKGSSIVVSPGGKLTLVDITLHNDCDDKWKGIFVESIGKKKGIIERKGKVIILDTNPLNNTE